MKRNECDRYRFAGGGALSTTPGANRIVLKDTSASGSPTANCDADGAKLLLASTNEAEVLTAYTGDKLLYDIDDLIKIVLRGVKVDSIDANTIATFGIASAQNDTVDSVAAHAWLKIDGAVSTSALVAESDDGVTDTNDVATGLTLSSTPLTFEIDFSTEVQTRSPPSLSQGKQATFWTIDSRGVRRRICQHSAFDLSGYSAGLQPFVQLQKGTGTGTPALWVWGIDVHYRTAN